mmetsp:Transcript_19630/g.49056  ORF Transcript_19630/g.49056 Transcript_19630/m.49056 type:complete len:372 (+) Transcript_19630:123-1238(+)
MPPFSAAMLPCDTAASTPSGSTGGLIAPAAIPGRGGRGGAGEGVVFPPEAPAIVLPPRGAGAASSESEQRLADAIGAVVKAAAPPATESWPPAPPASHASPLSMQQEPDQQQRGTGGKWAGGKSHWSNSREMSKGGKSGKGRGKGKSKGSKGGRRNGKDWNSHNAFESWDTSWETGWEPSWDSSWGTSRDNAWEASWEASGEAWDGTWDSSKSSGAAGSGAGGGAGMASGPGLDNPPAFSLPQPVGLVPRGTGGCGGGAAVVVQPPNWQASQQQPHSMSSSSSFPPQDPVQNWTAPQGSTGGLVDPGPLAADVAFAKSTPPYSAPAASVTFAKAASVASSSGPGSGTGPVLIAPPLQVSSSTTIPQHESWD